jgi:hypothetical protein
MLLTKQLSTSADFLATGNYGAEFSFVKYPAYNFTLFLLLFPIKYDAIADDFSPYILAEGKSVLELGKSASNGGNPVLYHNKEKP